MNNLIVNVMVCLLEGDTHKARKLMRSEPLDKNTSKMLERLEMAMHTCENNAVKECLQEIMLRSMKITSLPSIDDEESYFRGVQEVEKILSEEYEERT